MKDAFFRWWQKLSDLVYVWVTGFTYFVYSHRRYKGVHALSAEEKANIKQYWKRNYGKTVPMHQYEWIKSRGYDPDPRIIPDLFWHTRVEPAFTNLQMVKGFRDKNYFDTIVGKENSPESLCKCVKFQLFDGDFSPVDIDRLCSVLREEPEIICKPSIETGGGRNIQFLRGEEVTPAVVRSWITDYKGNFVVQKILKQHAFLRQMNPNSLNTMRIATFLYHGEVYMLRGGLRIGASGSRVDNVASGGFSVPIQKDGRLIDYAFVKDPKTKELTKIHQLPNDVSFAHVQIPFWEEIMQLLRKLHYKLPHFQLINWDVALREDGKPIIIEYNLIDTTPFPAQLGCGPIFGDLTETVLQDLASRKKRKYGKD